MPTLDDEKKIDRTDRADQTDQMKIMVSEAEPEVSVIIPVYNAAPFIEKAVKSVMIQDVPLEIIIIDDGSTDDTPQIVQKLVHSTQKRQNSETSQKTEVQKCADALQMSPDAQNQYKVDSPSCGRVSVRYFRNDHNMGVARSRNRGVSLARAPLVAFLDADDWWIRGKLKAQLEALSDHRYVLCCTARRLADEQGRPSNRVLHVRQEITYRDLLLHNSICCSSVLARKEALEAFPMTHEDSHEDYICWLQILKTYGSACGLDVPYVRYRMTSGSKSGTKLKSARMTFKVYRYMGFGPAKSCMLFISYAVHGVAKYKLAGRSKLLAGTKETL